MGQEVALRPPRSEVYFSLSAAAFAFRLSAAISSCWRATMRARAAMRAFS